LSWHLLSAQTQENLGPLGVSVYGLGRFPVTLYYEQWVRLLDSADRLRAFLEENKSKLKLKGEA
jgi:hypothetical protein